MAAEAARVLHLDAPGMVPELETHHLGVVRPDRALQEVLRGSGGREQEPAASVANLYVQAQSQPQNRWYLILPLDSRW